MKHDCVPATEGICVLPFEPATLVARPVVDAAGIEHLGYGVNFVNCILRPTSLDAPFVGHGIIEVSSEWEELVLLPITTTRCSALRAPAGFNHVMLTHGTILTMRILFVFHHLRTPDELGGLRSWHIAKAFAEAGHEAQVIAPGVDSLTGKRTTRLRGLTVYIKQFVSGFEVLRVNALRNDRSSKFRRALYYLSSTLSLLLVLFRVRRPAAVMSTSMPLTSMLSANIYARLVGAKFLVDVRDLTLDQAEDIGYFRGSRVLNWLKSVEAKSFRNADALYPVSNGMRELLIAKGVDAERVTTVPIGFEGHIYATPEANRPNPYRKLGVDDQFIVLYAGSMGFVYDVDTVIEAAHMVPADAGITFVFVGGGQRASAYEKAAPSNCYFLGQVPKRDIPGFCMHADVGINPVVRGHVIKRLLGNKIFDYLGNGLPTIYLGPDDGDVASLLESSGAGWILPAGGANPLAELLLDLRRQPNEVSFRGERGRTYVNRNLRTEALMKRLVLAVNSAIDNA